MRYDNINELILKHIKKNPEIKKNAAIAKLMIEEDEINYTIDHLSFLIKEFRKNNDLNDTVSVNVKSDDDSYDVVDGHYMWNSQMAGQIKIPVEVVDQIFYEYSKHGLDLSQMSIRKKHNLSIPQWHSIKRTLWLYKDSDIFSPYTCENTDMDEMQKMVASKMEMKFNDKSRLVEDEYNKAVTKEYNKAIKTSNMKTYALETMVDYLYDIVPETKVLKLSKTPVQKGAKEHLIVTIADLHIGSRVEGLDLTPNYDSGIVREHLSEVAKRVNEMSANHVTLCILGDLIESFTGLNQISSWQSIEFGMYGANVIKETMDILEGFFEEINNLDSVLAIGGNHDRITSNYKEDRKSQVAEIVFWFLQRMYGDDMEIVYDPLVHSRNIDGITYIITHGDRKLFRNDGKQAVIDYGDTNTFNVIMSGHIHTRGVKDDQKLFRWIVVPSIFSGNFYSEENGWIANPGFIMMYNDGLGYPVVMDHTLSNQ